MNLFKDTLTSLFRGEMSDANKSAIIVLSAIALEQKWDLSLF